MANKKETALQTQGFNALANADFSELMSEELDGLELTFEKIKIPSGGTTVFEISGEDGDPDTVKEFSAVILHHHPLFCYCRAVNSAKEQYKADNDWLTQFLEECCEYGANKVEKGSLLYAKYVDWCLATGEYKRCNRDFAHALEARGIPKKRGNRGVFWYGVAINDAPE